MLLCAHYILPITSSPFEDGAILVRDNRICDLGSAEMLKLRYPDEEVLDYGNAALMREGNDQRHLVKREIVGTSPHSELVACQVHRIRAEANRGFQLAPPTGGREQFGLSCFHCSH